MEKKGQILIDIESFVTSISLLEDSSLKEFYVEYKQSNRITGNIYKGKVVNVLQGLQTAFVNIGMHRNAFLYVGETLDDRSDLRKSGVIPSELNISSGDYVMVQATKEEIGLKGARLSCNISLPGRYLVYLPTIDFVGISNKITDEKVREKLNKLIEKIKPKTGGFIARTVCLDAKKSDIVEEAKQLENLFEEIKKSYDSSDGVSLIHSEGDLVFRAVRDMLVSNVESIICNDSEVVKSLKQNFAKTNVKMVDKVHFYDSDYDMFEAFGVLNEVDKLLDKKVNLPNGGSLVIEHTEALTAIDINTGKFIGTDNHEQTVFETNLEAATEIARQLRLRNIGGIIVVDFIDMMVEEHKNLVVERLKAAVAPDRTKTRVLDMSGLGLVEITRKKVGNELSTFLLDECPYCRGNAYTHSGDYVSRKLKCELKRLFSNNNFDSALIKINPHIMSAIFANNFFTRDCETIWKDKRIYLIPDDGVNQKNFTVTGSNNKFINLPNEAKLLY